MRIVELKTRFETWITKNDVNCVNLFHLYFLITLMAYLCSQWTPKVQIKYFLFDWTIYGQFVLNTDWKHDSFQMMIFVNVCSTLSMFQLKTRLEPWITRNDVKGVSLCQIPYLITHMANLCSRTIPNVQIKYFMFDWSIYRLFVLNTVWKRDSLQMMIFVYVCSTWGIVELKTRFETWITRNDVNGVSLFRFLI
jgi:hypothetical protein